MVSVFCFTSISRLRYFLTFPGYWPNFFRKRYLAARLIITITTVHTHTLSQYREVIQVCQTIFEKKTKDYGTAWRILRVSSVTDQIMIKAQRIRSIQVHHSQRVHEGIDTELIGIINYSVIALMQITLAQRKELELGYDELAPLYDSIISDTTTLLHNKNHDYREAWRDMRLSSIVDIILMKLLRIKRIENNHGTTIASEGVAANYQDIINYAVFASIKLTHGDQ